MIFNNKFSVLQKETFPLKHNQLMFFFSVLRDVGQTLYFLLKNKLHLFLTILGIVI